MFGQGCDEKGWFLEWALPYFKNIFTEEVMSKEENIRAVIYAMGGPLPSRLERYEFNLNLSKQAMRIYLWDMSHQQKQS